MDNVTSLKPNAHDIQAAALEYITPNGLRKVVRRPKTNAQLEAITLPFKDGWLSLRSWGRGKLALLVHGWAANQTDMFNYVPSLVDRGFRAVVLDLPAHGESSGETASLDLLAEGVLAAGNYFEHLDVVIAHSIGCAATQLAIANGLSVSKAVMLASPHNYELNVRRFAQKKGFDVDETELMIAALLDLNVRVAIRSVDFIPALNIPALIMHSNDDPEIPVSTGEELASYWTNSQFLRVDGLKHRGLLKDEKVIAQVLNYITG